MGLVLMFVMGLVKIIIATIVVKAAKLVWIQVQIVFRVKVLIIFITVNAIALVLI
jgi:hypothetical protein